MTVVPVSAFVALGANLGDAAATVRQAITDLGTLPQTRLVRASRLYRSAPWEASGPDFFNAVAEVATLLDAHALLAALHGLEQAAGRERPYLNAPRTLDLDLLLYGDDHIATPSLTVPHPRMDQRAFVLRPLAEIAADKVSATTLAAVAAQDARPL
ncbi:2-amino-4-hydroxy-6-hydroxymethyldihydropteridine diphosphokinase [Hydrogenophaga atypica]|uniref:2-amino-4-hydroxy-6-hydroxymethyldihydropteridine pyrophosphokinase n=1 Tax=Hydrogenophaga atypica TaxID=249409 RepID=A0ABW2QNF9_9BURK